ncbi:hypothetical protein L6164_020716 [Bauhinia variegata]|uniref:Uncharacterized protein n=1 Tax=Bauhinia variegata TaxID=167791 RepID=A0ACB9MWC1_BAUVA|nr:hypothetical protein L6164_020716 [Bauhinia variegata]
MEKSKQNYEVFISFRDPSTVRHQIGQYAKHFLKHEQRLKDNLQKVQNWRAALAEAANLSGWDCSVHRMESELVEKIANDLLQKLHGLRPDNDLEGEIAQRQEEAHLRSRDLNLRRDYNAMATALRIGQSQRQLGQSLLGLI